jgi:uncharacterized protein (TIGR02145 family)
MKKRPSIEIRLLVISVLFFVLATGCKKKDDSVTVTDIDGNTYRTVTIGTQVWLKENLKTTRFNDGTDIPVVTDRTSWTNQKTPGLCYYDNDDATYKNTYGALYNWYAVEKGNLCPAGWHVPSKNEWAALVSSLGGEDIAGLELKEKGTQHWQSPNEGATNSTGFSGLPGGWRYGQGGGFGGVGTHGPFWSTTPDVPGESAWFFELYYGNGTALVDDQFMSNGFSVRCIKN